VRVVRVGPLPHDELATRKIVERILARAARGPEARP
jgi:hypothetical protein